MANSVRKARNNRTSGVSKPTPGVVSNNETQRRDELANAYRQLGGTGNTDRMTIPTLEKNFTNLYEQNQANNSPVNVLTSSNPLTAIKDYRANYNAQQAASSLYNDIKNSQTERTLARTGQTQAARQGRNALVDQVSDSVVGMLTGTANFGSQKQNLTTEMKDAGITESDLRRYNNQRNNIEREETMRNLATSHPVLSTLGAVPSNLMESTDNNLKQLLNFVQGKPLEENRSNADIIRQTVGQNINIDSPEFLERLGLTDEKATNLGRLGYSGLNSIGDMALAGLVGGGGKLAAGLMGLEKSSETMNDAIRRGLTPEQILTEAGLSGISTALTERLPFERFSSGGHVLGSMLAEGLQEGSEDILDTIFDEIVTRVGGNKDKSALHSEYNEYINAGYSPEDALNAVVSNYKQQLITDTVLGGITGGLMGAGSNFVRGRNILTGKPRTTETKSDIPTVNAVEDIPENIPTVAEGRVNPVVQTEAQTENVIPEVQQTAQPEVKQNVPSLDSVVKRAERATNNFLNGFNSNVLGMEELGDLRNELLNLGNQNPDARQQINDLWRNVVNTVRGNQAQNVEPTQTVSNRDLIQQGRDTRNLINLAEQYKAKLSSFGNKSFNSQIDNAITALRNGDPNATENLNTLLAQIDEQMNGETVGVSERALNQDMYDQMKNVTDGRVIHISPETLRAMDMSVTELNDKISTGTGEALSNWVQQMTELGNKYPEARNSIGDIVDHTYADFRNNLAEVENAGLKEEVASINNVQDAQAMLESEIDSLSETYPLNAQFFGGGNEDADVDTEESISDQRRRDFHTGIYKDSKVSTNSFPRSKALNKTEMNTVLTEEQKQYEAVTHEATLERATKELKEDGYKSSVEDILTKKDWDAVDTDKAMLCAFKSAKEARYKVKQGADPTKAWQQTVDLFKTIREHATAGGQAIEALKKWASRTPEGKLAKAIAFARELAETADPKSEAAKQVAKQNNVVFTDEFMTEFLEKAHQYDDQEVSFAKQARLDQELAHMVWSQIPKTWRAKFTSLWMDNLLASFRTLISRNVGGNAGKFALDQTATKLISGPIDTLISRLTGGKTTTGFTKEGWKVAKQGLKQGAFNTTMDYWGATLDPDKVTNFKELVKELKDVEKLKENIGADASVSNRPGNEGDFNETLKNNRTVFEKKAFKVYDKLIKYGLAVSDNTFYKSVYDQTLYELNTLRKEGKLEKALQDLSDDKFETWAKAVATSQGLEAVYQNDSTLSNGAMDIKKGVGEISKGLLGVDVVSNASFPFVRTPMNVINTNLEYSPLGVVKNTINTIKEIRENLKNNRAAFTTETSGGSFKQNRFVRETSRNIVGSLLFGLALVMKNAGMLTGAYSDNEKEREEQKKSGMQEYAFVNPLNGNQYSVDWIPALGSNLVAGSAFDDAFRRPDQSGIDAVLNGAKAGAKSLFEQSALQGLQRLVGQQSFNTEDSVIDNAINAVANTASSAAVPSFLRQTAAALDPYKRNTYGMGGRESIINNFVAGIPILREHLLQPRIGSDGQPIEQNAGRNGLEKWLDNLVNPAMVTVPSAMDNAVRDEAMRLYNVTKNYDAFQPNIGRDYLEVNGRQTNTAEYTEFLQRANSAMNSIANNVIQSEYYQALPDERKEQLLSNIYSIAKQGERVKFLDLDPSNLNGDVKAYLENGEEGLVDYVTAVDALNQMGLANNDKNREAMLSALERNGYGSLPQMYQNYETNRYNAWQELNLGGEIDKQYSGLDSFFTDVQYENLSNELADTIRTVEANRAIGYNRDYTEAAKAYAEGGTRGLVEYLYPTTILKQYGIKNNDKNRQAIMDAYAEGGANAVRSELNAMQVFGKTTYGESLNTAYNHASTYLPTLNPQQFATLYDNVDQQSKGESGYNRITQQEIIDYLNLDPGAYNNETALQYWNAFDQNAGTDDQWKKIPVLVNGVWTLKKV